VVYTAPNLSLLTLGDAARGYRSVTRARSTNDRAKSATHNGLAQGDEI
jgi:hypothetical protein